MSGGTRVKRFVEGQDRDQLILLPECLDDYVGENNPVRVVDAFVAELDLAALGFTGVVPEATGRPSYHPANTAQDLSLWLPEPYRLEPTPRARSPAQHGADVADRPADPGLQDDR